MEASADTGPVSQAAFASEVRDVMADYEISDIDEAVEETLEQLRERGADISGVDVGAFRANWRNSSEPEAPKGGSAPALPAEAASVPKVPLPAPVSELCETLCDHTKPIGMRMRSLFYLRSVGGEAALDAICHALQDKAHNGSLLRHELGFVLGQMNAVQCLPVLEAIIRDTNDDAMTRHECCEAVGAFGLPKTRAILEEFSHDQEPEVRDTCILALDRLAWKESQRAEACAAGEACAAEKAPHARQLTEQELDMSLFNSVDPAPPLIGLELEELAVALRDAQRPLFERYGALFALRNMATDEAVKTIAAALDEDRSSALLSHEIAYVLGQLESPIATSALIRCLANLDAHVIARHEAAEALGAIGTDECIAALEEFRADADEAVAQSCVVALDVVNYWAGDAEEEAEDGARAAAGLMTKSQAAAAFAAPLQCSCTTRVVPRC
jgi:deoxyhypusine monooxygenase